MGLPSGHAWPELLRPVFSLVLRFASNHAPGLLTPTPTHSSSLREYAEGAFLLSAFMSGSSERWQQRTDWAEWHVEGLLSQPFISERVFRSPQTLDKTQKEVVDFAIVHENSCLLVSQKAQDDPRRRSPDKNELWVRKKAKEAVAQLSGAIRAQGKPMWCRHWRRGRVEFPDGLPRISHALALIETFHQVDLQSEEAHLPLTISGVPVTYMSLNDFLNLAHELRTIPELLEYLEARRGLPFPTLRLIGHEKPLFEYYLVEGESLAGCVGHADAELFTIAHEHELATILRTRMAERMSILAIEHVADALATRHPEYARDLPPDLLRVFDDPEHRSAYLALQGVIAGLKRVDRAYLGEGLLGARATLDHDGTGFTFKAAHFEREGWVFVLCACRGVDRVEVLRRLTCLMRAAMAFYSATNCMVIVDREGVSYEVGLSRPGVELTAYDRSAGESLFRHQRHSVSVL